MKDYINEIDWSKDIDYSNKNQLTRTRAFTLLTWKNPKFIIPSATIKTRSKISIVRLRNSRNGWRARSFQTHIKVQNLIFTRLQNSKYPVVMLLVTVSRVSSSEHISRLLMRTHNFWVDIDWLTLIDYLTLITWLDIHVVDKTQSIKSLYYSFNWLPNNDWLLG